MFKCYSLSRLSIVALTLLAVVVFASADGALGAVATRPSARSALDPGLDLTARPVARMFPPDKLVCSNGPGLRLAARIDPGTGTSPFTYSWTGPDGFTSSDSAITVGQGLAPGSYVYALVVTGGNNVSSAQVSDTVTVIEAPTCSIDGPGTVCPSSTSSFCGPSGMSSYQWSITGNGTIVGPTDIRCVQVLAGSFCSQSFTLTLRTTNGTLELQNSNFSPCYSTETKVVMVRDTVRPVITCPPNITIECTESRDPSNTGYATATDNCNCAIAITYTDVVTCGRCRQDSTILRTWRATDTCGNSATCLQMIYSVDIRAPEITCPPTATVEYPGATDPGSVGSATAVDNCDPTPILTYTDKTIDGPCPQAYTIERTWVARDHCGNVSSCMHLINVVDGTAPEITCPEDVILECTEPTDPGRTGYATAVDPSGGTPTITYTDQVEPGNCPQAYRIIRTWRATDDCENSATCVQNITVIDSVPPQFTAPCPQDMTVPCHQVPDPATMMATDNCDPDVPVVFDERRVNGACSGNYTLLRSWTATDDCGNSTQCFQTVTVQDTIPPAITCPDDATIDCDASADPNETGFPRVMDNCDPSPRLDYTDVIVAGNCPQAYTIERTWVAIDECGNDSNCLQLIHVWDREQPRFTYCPQNWLGECDAVPPPDVLTATDNCDPDVDIVFEEQSEPGRCPHEYTLFRRWTATDDCGNSAVCEQVLGVLDTTAPQVTCPATLNVQCGSDVPKPDPGLVIATDNCDDEVAVYWVEDRSDGGVCPTTIRRTYRAEDDCGNSETCTQDIVIMDTHPPTIVCPGDKQVECDEEWGFGEPTVEDNCDTSPTLRYSDQTIPGSNPYEYVVVRTWTATDDCGNNASCEQRVAVVDTTAPRIACPSDARFECDEDIYFGDAEADDNCDEEVAITWSDRTVSGNCADSYQIVRTWVATDAAGNADSCDQTITVYDSTAPVITCPADVTVECDKLGDTGTATATDNCDADPTVSYSDQIVEGRCPDCYTIVRTWRAVDRCGNPGECVQRITVEDTTPPEITCPPGKHFEAGQNIDFGSPDVSDNCDYEIDVTFEDNIIEGTCPQSYTIERTWTATDDCGNSAWCMQVITVGDDTPPVITCPGNRTFQCNETVVYGQATAVDDGDPNPVITYFDKIIPGACGQAYTVERTWIATDDCGNADSCVQVVQVVDTTAPVITCPDDKTVNCNQPIDFGMATATDNCDHELSITWSDATVPGSNPQEYQVRRTWRATDDCGNTSTCVQTVHVVDDTGPVLVGPEDGRLLCDQPIVFTDPTATDNCDPNPSIQMVSNTVLPGPGECEYTYTRCWEARDAAGNVSNRVCQNIIRFEDTTPPVIVCAADKVIEVGDPIVFDEPQVSDNCPIPEVDLLNVTSEPTPGVAQAETTYTRCWIAYDFCGNASEECCQNITVREQPEPDPYCTFVCWNWTAACLENEYNRAISTPPACLRDDHFYDVFPSGVTIGTHAAPGLFTATWTSPGAVERFKCGYGLPDPLHRDYVDPRNTDLGALEAEILTLRLNREFSCTGYFEAYGYPLGEGCFGEFVIPPEVLRFAGLTIDQFLAIADRAVAGDKSALLPYGYSYFRLYSAATYLNWLFGECNGYGTRDTNSPLALGVTPDGETPEDAAGLPEQFSMTGQPNPLRGSITIRLALPADGDVCLDIYDVQGRVVANLIKGHKTAGWHSITWNATDNSGSHVVSGVYFCRVQVNGQLMALEKLMKM